MLSVFGVDILPGVIVLSVFAHHLMVHHIWVHHLDPTEDQKTQEPHTE